MTEKDEDDFSISLRLHMPKIRFIDIFSWSDSNPLVYDSLRLCRGWVGSHAAILNEEILSLEEYKKKCVSKHPSGIGYSPADIGNGLIQYLPSRVGDYVDGCLGDGRLACSFYPENEPETGLFVKKVWRIFKEKAEKVYLINRETGAADEKPDAGLYAWPDAARKYNGKGNCYLTSGALAYFIPASAIAK